MQLKKVITAAAVAATMGLGTPGSEACTSLIATPGATANGSSMITYAADSHVLYGELYNQPAANHAAGTMRPVVDWDTRTPLGEIPEAAHTYATIGNMNEHGLTIAESTWGGREELKGSGTIDYGSLIYITLQRARTAREAITVMTDLVDKYGYASEGESFSIADPNDPETLYSKDVIDFARQQGYFTGKDEDFDFSRAYANYDMGALRGCDGRVWAYFNKFAPKGTMDEYLPWVLRGEGPELPLWVKPEAKLSATDLKWMMRDHFEDTPMDMTKDIGAGPFAVPYRWRPLTYKVDGQEYTHERAIATQQTGFSFVAEMNKNRHQAMKGILWFGTDDANTCVYLPVFNSTAVAPYQLQHGNGDILTLSWDANFWVNNYVANQAYNRYSQMIPDIRRVQKGLEDGIADAVAAAEKDIAGKSYTEAQSALATITNHWTAKATKDYKALGDFLLVKYLDGNIKKQNDDGSFKRTETGDCASPVFGGYDERYYRSITNEQGDRLKVIELK